MHYSWTIVPVALRKESVDRNVVILHDLIKCTGSLSARRAWIEISQVRPIMVTSRPSLSARRAWIEIVAVSSEDLKELTSLSARRAWIEMVMGVPIPALPQSLSARRAWIEMHCTAG